MSLMPVSIGSSAAAKDQQAVVGSGGVGVPGADIVHDSAGQGLWFSAQGSCVGIEALGRQLATPGKHEKPAAVNRVGLRAEQRAILCAIERGVVQGIVCGSGWVVVDSQIEEMPAVGKEERPAMRSVQGGIELGERDRGSARGSDTHQGGLRAGCEYNDAARPPCAAAAERCVANHAGRAAAEINRFHLTLGEESEGAAVEGP